MKTYIALALAGVGQAYAIDQVDMEFMRYVVNHNKEYKTAEEYAFRKEIFKTKYAEIQEINATETTSVHGLNYLTDWTDEEYMRMLGQKDIKINDSDRVIMAPEPTYVGAYPTSYDWRTYGYVNPVKNQGGCGSCYSFATTAVLESNYAILHGTLWNLSEQQIVDCSDAYGNSGCNGGLYEYGWNYAHVTPIATSTNYPYTSGTSLTAGTCKYSVGTGKVYSNTIYQSNTSSTAMQANLYDYVMAVAIKADTTYFQSYTSGVLTNATACGTTVNHAVTLIGWGYDSVAGNFWIVRNSWGTGWGLSGYVNIGWASYPGICGINKLPEFTTTS